MKLPSATSHSFLPRCSTRGVCVTCIPWTEDQADMAYALWVSRQSRVLHEFSPSSLAPGSWLLAGCWTDASIELYAGPRSIILRTELHEQLALIWLGCVFFRLRALDSGPTFSSSAGLINLPDKPARRGPSRDKLFAIVAEL